MEGSLKRLRLSHIDSFIIHNPPIEYLDGRKNDHYDILEKLKEEGKIRAYGASLDTPDEMKLLMQTTQAEVIEAFYNILHQDTANAFETAQRKNVGIIAKIPLDSGWLTGKYDEKNTFSDIRSRWSKREISVRANLVKKVKEIIGDDISLVHAALSFSMAHPAVSTVIPGCSSIEQLDHNLESVNNRLSQEKVLELRDFYWDEVQHLNLPW